MYAVTWGVEAFDQMSGIIARHPARRAELANALRLLADQLLRAADDEGESRDGDFRVTFVGPLTIDFRVDLEDRLVEIARVILSK